MTISEQIAAIDDKVNKIITRQCDPPQINVLSSGRVRLLYAQNDRRFLLFDKDLKRVTIESTTYHYQSAHLLDSGRPVSQQAFGSFQNNNHVLNLAYLGVSLNELDFVKVLECLEKSRMVGITNYILNSEQVIRDDWRTTVGDDRNYNPNLFAFRINYTLIVNHLSDLT
ncbi:hypothetical protein [Runella sp.]|uniref:hypothetical protein n=1 Tax=Runella sp. TaxID=1960881 RepID=UPI003D125EB5